MYRKVNGSQQRLMSISGKKEALCMMHLQDHLQEQSREKQSMRRLRVKLNQNCLNQEDQTGKECQTGSMIKSSQLLSIFLIYLKNFDCTIQREMSILVFRIHLFHYFHFPRFKESILQVLCYLSSYYAMRKRQNSTTKTNLLLRLRLNTISGTNIWYQSIYSKFF